MTQVCKICVHPERMAIEKRIVAGCNLTELAREFNVSYDSLYNHSQLHVTKRLSQAIQKQQLNESFDLLTIVDTMLRDVKKIYDRNFKEGKDIVALKAVDSLRNLMELLVKVSYSLHQSKLLELEVLQAQNKKEDKTLDETFVKGLENLTNSELDMFGKLMDKIFGKTNNVIIPEMKDKFEVNSKKFYRKKHKV